MKQNQTTSYWKSPHPEKPSTDAGLSQCQSLAVQSPRSSASCLYLMRVLVVLLYVKETYIYTVLLDLFVPNTYNVFIWKTIFFCYFSMPYHTPAALCHYNKIIALLGVLLCW